MGYGTNWEDLPLSNKPVKTRKWWFILYPESAPSDWLDSLKSTMIQFAVSPLHEFDRDKDGNLKKPHYHVMLYYSSGSTTYNHVLELTRSLNQTIPLRYDSYSGAYAYLTHSNDPDKYQYSSDDIQLFNGFNPPSQIKVEESSMKTCVINFIRDNLIFEFSDLLDSLVDMGQYRWLDEVMTHSYSYVQYLRSLRIRRDAVIEKSLSDIYDSDADFFKATQQTKSLDDIPDLFHSE